jgi:hypothetical protein
LSKLSGLFAEGKKEFVGDVERNMRHRIFLTSRLR